MLPFMRLPQLQFLVSFLTLPVMLSASPSLEEILGGILEANGGADAIQQANTLRVVGQIETDDIIYDFILLKKRPNLMRITLRHLGRVVESGYDGQTAWRQTRVGQESQVEILDPTESMGFLEDLDFDGPLIGDVGKGKARRAGEPGRIDRVLYYKVIVSSRDTETTHYIDSRTFREHKTISRRTDEDGEVRETVSAYSEYHRVGPIWLAYRIDRTHSDGREEIIRVTDAQLNPGIFDSAFAVPGPRDRID